MDLDEKYKKLKTLLEKEKFPKPYMFKFIILTNKDKEMEVKNCFTDGNPEIKTSPSKSNKYTTIQIIQKMNSAQEIIDKYKAVSKIKNVIHI
ncbi:MAG TPA: DUF493 family protein [Crocinitomix sp.]|nr:DUF493 family protein [Crocinitomix sp.]